MEWSSAKKAVRRYRVVMMDKQTRTSRLSGGEVPALRHVVTLKTAWCLAWMILGIASLPPGLVETRHVVGAALVAVVMFLGRRRIFGRRGLEDGLSRPRLSCLAMWVIMLATWLVLVFAARHESLRIYLVSALAASVGLAGLIVLDLLAAHAELKREKHAPE